jgi:hypothetical protein
LFVHLFSIGVSDGANDDQMGSLAAACATSFESETSGVFSASWKDRVMYDGERDSVERSIL